MIAIIDYDRGNLFSLGRALDQFDAAHHITGDPDVVAGASKIILPGVGSFGDAMASLKQKGLADALIHAASLGVPVFGICLGMQLFATKSEEFGETQGLNLIPGTVKKLPKGLDIRIPNVGWRTLNKRTGGRDLDGVAPGTMMYFVHSYALEADDENDVVASIDVNGEPVTAMVHRDNIIGCQFHPEKSGPAGLKLIQWFLEF